MMRAYEVSKGTKGLLLSNQKHLLTQATLHEGKWTTREFTTVKEHLFCDDDMLIDPVRVYNGNSQIDPDSTIYKLATRGYMVFAKYPTKRQAYLLAVPYSMVGIK